MSKTKHNCNDCIHESVCEWAVYSEDIFCQDFIDKKSQDNLTSMIDELCNDYCRNCILIYKSSGCADCTCAHVREIVEGGKHD